MEDCVQWGKRKHSFWDDPVGDMLTYLREPWANKIVAIAHNTKAFDLHFVMNRAILLKWKLEIIMNSLKIMCMKMEHLVFLDSMSFLPSALRKLPEAFRVYVGRRVLGIYCEDDVAVLRQACRVFRQEFMQIVNIEMFLDAITIASACYKFMRKLFLKTDTIGLVPIGGYTFNNKNNTKTMMWLMHMEQTDGVTIKLGRNGREYRLPELACFSVDGYCRRLI